MVRVLPEVSVDCWGVSETPGVVGTFHTLTRVPGWCSRGIFQQASSSLVGVLVDAFDVPDCGAAEDSGTFETCNSFRAACSFPARCFGLFCEGIGRELQSEHHRQAFEVRGFISRWRSPNQGDRFVRAWLMIMFMKETLVKSYDLVARVPTTPHRCDFRLFRDATASAAIFVRAMRIATRDDRE